MAAVAVASVAMIPSAVPTDCVMFCSYHWHCYARSTSQQESRFRYRTVVAPSSSSLLWHRNFLGQNGGFQTEMFWFRPKMRHHMFVHWSSIEPLVQYGNDATMIIKKALFQSYSSFELFMTHSDQYLSQRGTNWIKAFSERVGFRYTVPHKSDGYG